MGAGHRFGAVIITTVAGLGLAACGAPDSGVTSLRTSPIGSGSTTTAPAPTTTAVSEPTSTTVKRTTVPTPAPTTTTTLDPESLKAEWSPACVARTAAPTLTLVESALDTFGPLALTPAFTLTLPTAGGGSAGTQSGRGAPVTLAVRIPGGVLVVLTTTTTNTTTPVIAVNLDGSLRWVQCLEGGNARLAVAPVAARPDRAVVTLLRFRADSPPVTEYVGVSLATGAVTTTHDDIARTVPMTTTRLSSLWTATRAPDGIVLAGGPNPGDLTGVDELYRLDLRTLALTSIPVPAEAGAPGPGRLADVQLSVTAGGELALVGSGVTPPLRAVLRGGQWVRTASVLAAARPTLVTYETSDSAAGLVGVDAQGTELWRRPDLTSPSLQGMASGGTDPVVIVDACVQRSDGPLNCATFATLAVDAATGKELWRLDGFRQVAAVADGFALVTDGPIILPEGGANPDPSWQLVELGTGRPVSGQAWPAGAFRQECCGGSDTVWSQPFGGVMIAADGTRLRAWLPATLGGAGVAVTVG